MKQDANFSSDRMYRWWLIRCWDERLPMVATIGVNPSTADAQENDQTIRKDIGFATRHGYGGILKLNLAAFVATNPKVCKRAEDPIGYGNSPMDMRFTMDSFGVTDVWFCWGRNSWNFPEQTRLVELAFPNAKCFGLNQDGTPRPTLLVPYKAELVLYKHALGVR